MDDPEQGGVITSVEVVDPVHPDARTAGAAADACPSCDAPGSWTLNKRHRFNPFGGVTLLAVSFWVALLELVVGWSLLPAAVLAMVGLLLTVWRRTVFECQVCGYVRARGGRDA